MDTGSAVARFHWACLRRFVSSLTRSPATGHLSGGGVEGGPPLAKHGVLG